MYILNIAEKPSVAKSISYTLSQNVSKIKSCYKYCPNYQFAFKKDKYVFTSVLGHLFEADFRETKSCSNWKSFDPFHLFDLPIEKTIPSKFQQLKKNILQLADKADKVIIWTDCDREGENIASQVRSLVLAERSKNRSLDIKRARFSAIVKEQIFHALNNLDEIDINESKAVDARIELDLRAGSAFTRLQTLSLELPGKKIISFGSCQIPTLNFVVKRYFQIKKFRPEKKYTIKVLVGTDEFAWRRGYIYDKNCTVYFYQYINDGTPFVVDKIEKKEVIKRRPFPLKTVVLQKTCAWYYKLSSKTIMEIAEKLYTRGYISYPRTETDVYPSNFDFKNIISKLTMYQDYISVMKYKLPKKGKSNDQAHTPIYPLKSGADLSGQEKCIYDFISRSFLACCSEDAVGEECLVEIKKKEAKMTDEVFYKKGLKILEANFLQIYIFEKWNSMSINKYEVQQNIRDYKIDLYEDETANKKFLTEPELIDLMDKNGIGTDATIHEHIQKIQMREYCYKYEKFIVPTNLGINLITSYDKLGMEITDSKVRRELEQSLEKICRGVLDKEICVKNEIVKMKEVYGILKNSICGFIDIMKTENGNLVEEFCGSKIGKSQLTKDARENSVRKKKDKISKTNKNISKLCKCSEVVSLLTVKNEKNKGKEYFGCHYQPRKCNFFEWANATIDKLNEQNKPIVNNENEASECICYCGVECKRKIANTEKNNGRIFYCCNRNYKKCKFFKWED